LNGQEHNTLQKEGDPAITGDIPPGAGGIFLGDSREKSKSDDDDSMSWLMGKLI
jgi:hypothetical protein